MLLTVHKDISDIGYPVGYPVGFVPICSFLVPLVPSRSPKDFYAASGSHYLIWFSLALLDTGAGSEGQEKPTDDATQDIVEEEGQVIGQAEIVEDQAGTSGDPLGAVGGNVVVQNEEEEEEDEDDPDVDKKEYLRQINKQGEVS